MESVATLPQQTRSHHSLNYNRSPIVLFWEITLACALACVHCRAQAQPKRHPEELTTEEGFRFIDQVASFPAPPILIITGGDPMMRRDLFTLIEYGVARGLRVSLSPSVTALIHRRSLARVRQAGVERISFSLDGSCPDLHDSFRGVNGAFQRTVDRIADATDAGLSVQINTTVTRRTLPDLPAIAALLQDLGVVLWDLFFLVPVGRAQRDQVISPEEHEATFNWLYDLSSQLPFDVKTTLGQPYRRVTLQRQGTALPTAPGSVNGHPLTPTTNDGKGICFVSHRGDIQPSGFLPLVAGNVRAHSLVDVYQNSTLFRQLRDPSLLKGKCGLCPFNQLCGGCRARAYGFTGDYLAAEPCCIYQPPTT